MEKNHLLVVSNHYLTFVKDQTKFLSENFDKINALVRFNPIMSILGYRSVIDMVENPLNTCAHKTPILYFPSERCYKQLGPRHYRAAEKVIRRNGIAFDIIHSHFTWSSGYAGARLKEEYKVPFVVTAHGYDIYSLPFKDKEWREKIEYVLNTADHIITVSQSNLGCIKKLDVSTPVTVIPNGFRSDLFYPRDSLECRKKLDLPQDKKIILTVGNLELVKGQRYLVEAMQKVIRERKDALCVIVGSGKLRTKLERQIRSLGLDDFVLLAGGKPHDEIPLWMNACDLLVLPSLKESFGVVQIEALACGKPLVSTKNGGSEEIIISEDYGLLVKPADPDDLADNILEALDREWDGEAILRYAERFTLEKIAIEIAKIYSILMD